MAELELSLEGWEKKDPVFLRFTSLDESVVVEIPDPERPRLKEARREIRIPLGDLAAARFKEAWLPLKPGRLTLELKSVKNSGDLPLQNDTDLVFFVKKKKWEDAEAMAKEIRFSIMGESLDDMLDLTDL